MAHFARTRADLTAWSNGTAVTPAEFNDLDEKTKKALNADDGGVWAPASIIEIGGAGLKVTGPFYAEQAVFGDLAIVKNIVGTSAEATVFAAPVWSDVHKRWYGFSHSSGFPSGARKFGTGTIWSVVTIPSGDLLTLLSAASNPAGIVLLGGTPGSASTQKIRRSNDGTTWTVQNTVNSGAEGVARQGLIWHQNAVIFVAGLTNAVATNIETSPDGVTWSVQTGPNSHARGSMISNGSTVVVLANPNTTTDKCITSTNGVAWTERTLPTSQVWRSVVWDSYYQRFIAFGDSRFAYSSTGTTWTDGGTVPAASLRYAAVGRALMAVSMGGGGTAIYGGYFNGVSLLMSQVAEVAASGTHDIAAGDNQFMIVTSTNTQYWTLRGGIF
jgi:hypothetical protein